MTTPAPPFVIIMADYTYMLDTNGFILNTDDSNSLPFVDVTQITGLDAAPIRVSTSERESMDGTFIDGSNQSSRTVVITGTLYTLPGDPDSVLDTLRAEYSSAQVRPFFFKHPGKQVRFVNAQGGGLQYDLTTDRRLGITTVQATLLCSDPNIYEYPPGFAFTNVRNAIGTAVALNSNGTFEASITPWVGANGASLAQSTSTFFDGLAALQMTPDGVTANPQANAELVPLSAGDTYTASVWVLCPVGFSGGVQVAIDWYDVSSALISTSRSTAVPLAAGGIWQQVQLVATAPTAAGGASADATQGRINVRANGTPAGTTLFYFDDAFLLSDLGTGFPAAFNQGFGSGSPPTTVSATNNGTHDAYPFLQLFGPLTNPTIVDSVKGIVMRLSISISSTDVLIVDCLNKQITLNGTTSRRTAYTGIKWFTVPAGATNTFLLSADSGTGSLSVTLYNTYY